MSSRKKASVEAENVEVNQVDENKKGETKQEQWIYCGPNFPKAHLNQFTVFRGSIPKHLEKHIELCPAIRRLLVSPEKLNQTIQAIHQNGSAESVWFKQISDYIKGGAK